VWTASFEMFVRKEVIQEEDTGKGEGFSIAWIKSTFVATSNF
jgi:hypothetical protein